MSKIQSKRFQVGEIKSAILICILENEEMTSEPAIRDYLKKNYNVSDHGTINKHLHYLLELGCIELTLPSKETTRANRWDVKKLKNLKKIKQEFPEVHLNDYEKSINIVLAELEYFEHSPDWLNFYLKLLLSASFFNTFIETGKKKLDDGIWKVYITGIGSARHQRIDDLLKLCYSSYVKHHSEFKISEERFTNSMRGIPWEIYIRFTEDMIPKNMLPQEFEQYFPGLPEEIPHLFLKTRLVGLKEIPDEIPDEIIKEDIGKYALEALRLIIDQKLDFRASKDVLLLEHFFNHDIITGVVSKCEPYFVKQTKENRVLPSGSTAPWHMILKEAELADLRLASEMILNYKQPSKFSVSDSFDEIYQAVLKFYSFWQIQQ